ncbi:MAG: hypothetical protein OHK0015_41010 [Chloroflexi bacterium OHK40]
MKVARRCFLSTCGTSLLTNGRAPHERSLVTRYSNAKRQEAIPSDDAATLVRIIAEVRVQLLSAEPQQVASMSAELNTLLRYYDDRPLPPHDAHLLLCTDTWLGEEAARLVADYLQAQDCSNSLVTRRRDLQTAELTSFQLALSELVRWFEENLPTYRAQGFQVVFNLTGGFKSVQGFLQALAPFYADGEVTRRRGPVQHSVDHPVAVAVLGQLRPVGVVPARVKRAGHQLGWGDGLGAHGSLSFSLRPSLR